MMKAKTERTVSVLITDPMDEQCLEIFRAEGFAVDYRTGLKPDALKEAIAGADALIVRSQTTVSAEVLEAAKRLKVVGRAGAGVDNIDVEAATRQGVLVMNTPGGNTISTAEHTMSMMLALVRNIPQADRSLREGAWDRKRFVGTELFQKTLGVVGLGKVGAEVAKRSLGFGMSVLGFDPMLSPEAASKMGVRLVELDELLASADILTIHSPLIPETRNLISKEAIAKCKDGVRIINCARGGIVNESALLEGLESGKVAGAALDVFEVEPPGASPLVTHARVICTPHLAASTEEAQEKVAVQVAHQVIEFLKGRGVSGAVNAGALSLAMRKEVRPYLDLARTIGSLLAQVKEGTLRSVRVSASGGGLADSLPILGAAVLQGVFERSLSEPVNLLNAPYIAKERGIHLQLQSEDAGERYANVVSVAFETDKETRRCSGTVFGVDDPRIVEIDGFHFEVRPTGNLLMYFNIDRPGMLAAASAILARAKVNIAGLSLGRFGTGGKALTIISTDHAVSGEILAEIAAIDGVSTVRFIQL